MKAKLVFKDPGEFKDIMKTISELVREGELVITNNGLTFNSMDLANVAMCDLVVTKIKFDEIVVNEEEVRAGVNFEDLKKVLVKSVKAKNKLALLVDDKVYLEFIDEKGKKKSFDFSIIAEMSKTQKVPDLKHKATVELSTAEFKSLIEDAGTTAESLNMAVIDGQFKVKSKGEINGYNGEVEAKVEGENCVSKYSIEYLMKMANGSIASNVKLYLAKDYPLIIEYKNEGMTLKFLLAPRIEND